MCWSQVHGNWEVVAGRALGACSTGHRSNRPDHWDGLMLDRSVVGQLSSLSSRTKWQRLPAGDTVRSCSPVVVLDNDESCPTADLRQSQWSDLTLDCPNGPTYSTGELLNTPLVGHCVLSLAVICVAAASQSASQPPIYYYYY